MALPGLSAKGSSSKSKADKNNKASKPTTPKTSSTGALTPALAAASVFFLLLFAALYYFNAHAPSQAIETRDNQITTQQVVGLVGNTLSSLQKQANSLAEHTAITKTLTADTHSPTLQKNLEKLLTPALGNNSTLRIFSRDNSQTTAQRSGFAATDLARRIIEGATPSPEAARIDGKWQILTAAPIRENNTIIGTVLLSTPTTLLKKTLLQQLNGRGEIKVFQTQGSLPVLTVGNPSSSDSQTITLPSHSWKVAYTPLPTNAEAVSPWWPLAAAFVLALAAVAGLLHFTLLSSSKNLTADINLLSSLLKDIASGRQPQTAKFNQPLFHNLATTAIVAFDREAKRLPVENISTPPVPPVTPESQPASDSQTSEQNKPQKPVTSAPNVVADITVPDTSADEFASPLFQDMDDAAFDDIETLEEPESQSADQSSTPPSAQPSAQPSTQSAPATQAAPAEEIADSIFRAYDIRGIVGDTLTPESVRLIGQSIGSEVLNQGEKSIVVANDGRLSSPAIREQLIDGITSTGCDVISIGTVPTPVLYFATHELETSSGVMITGSHNPPDYNGFKIVIGGSTLAEDDIQSLHKRIQVSDFSSGQGQISSIEILSRYLKRVLDDVVLARPLKIVIDCGNGVAGSVAPQLFEQLGCDVVPLYCDVDGHFPNHHPDPSQPENLQDLINTVKEQQADIGIAFDGDGDRLGLVTNEGTIIHPDRLLMLLAKDVVSRNPGSDVIFDVKCTRRLNALISGYGGRPIMWKTGHSLIKRKMKETGALLAGEMSGHIFFKERWYGFDDAVYSAARLTEILTAETTDAEMTFQAFPAAVSTPEINVAVDDGDKFELIQRLSRQANFGDCSLNTIDGVRVDYPWGWGLARASNTNPMVVFRFEADTEKNLTRVQGIFRDQLNKVEPNLRLPF